MLNQVAYNIGGSLAPSLIVWFASTIIRNVLRRRFVPIPIKSSYLFLIAWIIASIMTVFGITQVGFLNNIAIKLLLFSILVWVVERVV